LAAVSGKAFEAEDYGPLSNLGVGGCSIAEMKPDLVPADVIAKVEAKQAAIKDGSFEVAVDDNEPKSTK
jgi:basic membrane protein A